MQNKSETFEKRTIFLTAHSDVKNLKSYGYLATHNNFVGYVSFKQLSAVAPGSPH